MTDAAAMPGPAAEDRDHTLEKGKDRQQDARDDERLPSENDADAADATGPADFAKSHPHAAEEAGKQHLEYQE